MLSPTRSGHVSRPALELERPQVSLTEMFGLSSVASAALDGHAVTTPASLRTAAPAVIAKWATCASALGRVPRR